MKRLFFLDLDGTVITEDQEVPTSAQEAIRQVVKDGHEVFMCTGRSLPEVYPWLWDIGFCGIVGGNGAYGQLGDKVLFDEHIDSDTVHFIEDFFTANEGRWIWQNPDGMYTTTDYLKYFSEGIPQGNTIIGDWADYVALVEPRTFSVCTDRATKAMVTFPPDSPITYEDVLAAIGQRVDVIPAAVSVKEGLILEVGKRGISKGTGLLNVVDALGMPVSSTVAVGDAGNDVSMLREAGVSVAMGNATSDAIEAAQWVAPRIDEDGLAAAIEYALSQPVA
ncbi:MAG: HAD family hydrolase [Actinomycetaceae bacterium]|nr:HAD family hydrolase [Actinomycetaceae bacterium]